MAIWADWIELNALFGSKRAVSRADFREALEAYFPKPEELEERVDAGFKETGARKTLLGDAYPFQLTAANVEALGGYDSFLNYAFLLALNCRWYYPETTPSGADFLEPAKLFEHLTALGVAQYLHGSAIRIGFPREAPVPANFAESLTHVASEMYEASRAPVNPRANDDDVDVIGWSPFVDRRGGQVTLLVQCKTGYKWISDLRTLPMELWREQMSWHIQPLPSFAFPFTYFGSPDEWKRVSLTSGLPLDRLRLSALCSQQALSEPIRIRVLAWCQEYASKLPHA